MKKPPKNRWFFLSGDVSPESHGGMWVRLTDHDVELVRVENAQDMLGEEAADVDGPFFVTTGGFELSELDTHSEKNRAIASIGCEDHLKDAEPAWRPLIIAEALFRYGCGVTDDAWGDTSDVARAFAPQKQVDGFSRRAFRQAARDWKRATQPNKL